MEALLLGLLGIGVSALVEVVRDWLNKSIRQNVRIRLGGQELEMSTAESTQALESLVKAMEGTSRAEQAPEPITPETIAQRKAELAEVEEQLRNARRQLELSQDQMRAAIKIVDEALDRRGRKEFWQGIAVNFGFFVAGVLASLVIQ